ncbi:uncharacterized protein LOC130712852 [Lotus japonicus]|uniref:uncharacterized protein LOC130712852 n=1 Tax=Lotus japonicus TaxID=34305 RepID=UPI00258AAE94|nr:uncharacterized protein LOC130712852 [Lotus japonicus]
MVVVDAATTLNQFISFITSEFEELLAIYYGLNLAWDYGARKVECQSDSLDAVNLVLSNPSQRHMYASLIWDIKDLLARAWDVQLYHTLREGNACADFLANMGRNRITSS